MVNVGKYANPMDPLPWNVTPSTHVRIKAHVRDRGLAMPEESREERRPRIRFCF